MHQRCIATYFLDDVLDRDEKNTWFINDATSDTSSYKDNIHMCPIREKPEKN